MKVLDFYADSCLTSPLCALTVTRDHSVGGSYLGCEPMGLFWALQPASGAREGLRQVMKRSSLRAAENIVFGIKPDCLLSYTPSVKTDISK